MSYIRLFARSSLAATILRIISFLALSIVSLQAGTIDIHTANNGKASTSTVPADALLLYRSTETNAGYGFEKAVAFYGLALASVDLSTTPLTDALLKDSTGQYYRAVFVDGTQIDAALDQTSVQVLANAMTTGGLNVLVSNFRVANSPMMNALTGGEITGSSAFSAASKNYTVTLAAPEITQQLTGINVRHATPSADYKLAVSQNASHLSVLATASDDSGTQWPLFARYKNGAGNLFVVSNYTDSYLRNNLLTENYYAQRTDSYFTQQWFSQITPLLMFVRYAGGDRAWHMNHNYANFTVDDPKLLQAAFDFAGMLQQTISHNFHFTLAAVPGTIDQREQSVLDIFHNNPDRMSIVQHGDTHVGYEFYRHVISATDPYSMYVSSLAVQEAHLIEGRAGMQSFSQSTGIAYGQIMVFPFGISPSDTLTLLKKYNFQATVNSSDVPLDTPRSRNWDAYMHPAELDYNNFPVYLRYGTAQSPYPFLFFLGKPVFEYDHVTRFANGIDAYDQYADVINSVYGGKVEWQSLDYILKHLYHQKLNRDNSVDVMFWGNDIIITNDSNSQRTYHIQREETLNVPIQSVTVNGFPAAYTVSNGVFQIDAPISPGSSREIQINYNDGTIPQTSAHRVFMPICLR